MGQLSHGSDGSDTSDWTDLERGFFAAAPPDVAVQPPPPPSFDDLGPIGPIRAPRRTAAARKVETARAPKTAGALSPRPRAASALAFFRRVAQQAGAVARPSGARAWRWVETRARLEARRGASASRRVTPRLRVAREQLDHGLRALLARIGADLPERPDSRTIVAAMAALIVVFGVSASVLGSRSNGRPSFAPAAVVAPPATAVVPPPAAVAIAEPSVVPSAPGAAAAPVPEAAPEAAPVPVPEAAPAATKPTKVTKVRAVARRHRAKSHAARGAFAPLHAHAAITTR